VPHSQHLPGGISTDDESIDTRQPLVENRIWDLSDMQECQLLDRDIQFQQQNQQNTSYSEGIKL